LAGFSFGKRPGKHNGPKRKKSMQTKERSGGFGGYFMKSRSFSVGDRRPRYRAPKNFGAKKRGFGGIKIDPAKFVNKAVMVDGNGGERMNSAKFADFSIDEILKRRIAAVGYQNATPIQELAIPPILSGADVVGVADTGTGKTAAFLVPLINKVLSNRRMRILIVAPTRELAAQTDEEFKKLAQGMKMFSACCVGGASVGRQLAQLRYFNNFIIGTPGRLKDFIDRKRINLAEFSAIVLDEADRMMDMGFIADMRFLMAGMPKERQTLFFSATLSPEIKRLIGEFLREPVFISIKTRDTSKNVEQDVVKVAGRNKVDLLREMLVREEFKKVLIFGRTKFGVEKLCKTLEKSGIKAESIHGDKKYSRRVKALETFKSDRVQVLVATDVAARGLDIAHVTHVINYDLPQTWEDYVHRIGRTGRGANFGKALTFID
jgi:superfamily II DNA/RNA helicase